VSQPKTGLGPREAEFLTTFASEGRRVFTVQEAQPFWGEAEYASNTLGRLEAGGWIRRLERGTYVIVPLEAGPEHARSENALVIAAHLIRPSAIAYCSALHYWQMTEHLPNAVYVQSTSRKHQRAKEILGISYRFVTVVASKFFGLSERSVGRQTLTVTDREKTLVDAADRPDLCRGIALLGHALRTTWSDLDHGKLEEYLYRWPTGSPLKRIGYMVESMNLPLVDREERLDRWRSSLSSGIVDLDPGRPAEGQITTRWGLRLNVGETWITGARPARLQAACPAESDPRTLTRTTADEEERLVAELERLGIRYLSRRTSYQAPGVRPPEQLLADLVRQPHARVRSAVIALLLLNPRYAQAVPAALQRVSGRERLTLRSLYEAAFLLQQEHAERLGPLLGERWDWLPDLVSVDLGLPPGGNPRERLEVLDRELRRRTRVNANWMGTYEAVVEKLIRQLKT